MRSGTANTALTNHAKKTFALMEGNLPFHIKIEKKPECLEIFSKDFDDFDGWLEHPMSAHPKVDREKDELINLTYKAGTN